MTRKHRPEGESDAGAADPASEDAASEDAARGDAASGGTESAAIVPEVEETASAIASMEIRGAATIAGAAAEALATQARETDVEDDHALGPRGVERFGICERRLEQLVRVRRQVRSVHDDTLPNSTSSRGLLNLRESR